MSDNKGKWDKYILRGFFSGKLNAGLKDIIRGWLMDSDRREEKWDGVEEIFNEQVKRNSKPDQQTIRSLKEMHRILGFPEHISSPIGKKKNLLQNPVFRVAAMLAVIVTATIFIYRHTATIPERNVVTMVTLTETPDESHRVITLPDGSRVELKNVTVFSYPENFMEDRTVYLEGEAFFKVTNLGGQPFTVNSKNLTVNVLGTEFNMMCNSDVETAEVMLAEGKVAVKADGLPERLMSPGDHLVYNIEHKTIDMNEIGNGQILRMRGMSLSFSGETLDEIFRTVGQYYGVNITVVDHIDVERTVTVDFQGDETLDDVMFVIQNATGLFNYTIAGDTITVTRQRR